MSRLLSVLGVMVLGQAWASVASAHIELLEPPSRYGRQQNKSCPCGVGGSNQTCNVAQDGSDPNRSQQVTTFEAGSTVVIQVDEYIDHGGRFRVAFDPDGADFEDFNDNILLDVADPMGVSNNTGQPGIWELEVTLPETPCDNCTLQVIQAMHGDTNNPVVDPANLSTYYTCADLVLLPAGDTTGPTDGSDTSSASDTTTGGVIDMTTGSTTAAETGGSTTGTAPGTSSTTAGSNGTTNGTSTTTAGDPEDGSGTEEGAHEGHESLESSSTSASPRDTEGEGTDDAGEASNGQPSTPAGCACDVGAPYQTAPWGMLAFLGGLGWLRRRR